MKETYEGLGYKVYAYDFLSFSSGFHQQAAKDEEKKSPRKHDACFPKRVEFQHYATVYISIDHLYC
jgi:hypothetical protein